MHTVLVGLLIASLASPVRFYNQIATDEHNHEPESAEEANPLPVLHLEEEVSPESVSRLIKQIQSNQDNARAIILEINSPGGSVLDGIELAKAIEYSKPPVVCVVDGMAASMAAYILQSCQMRVMTRRSLLMFHQPASGSPGTIEGLRKTLTVLEKLAFAMSEHECARLKMDCDKFRELTDDKELWMTWRDAAEAGAVDTVAVSLPQVVEALQDAIQRQAAPKAP